MIMVIFLMIMMMLVVILYCNDPDSGNMYSEINFLFGRLESTSYVEGGHSSRYSLVATEFSLAEIIDTLEDEEGTNECVEAVIVGCVPSGER